MVTSVGARHAAPAGDACVAPTGRMLKPIAMLVICLVTIVVGCGRPGQSPSSSASGGSPQSSAPKKVVAAIRGDPKSLSQALNGGSGGSVQGVRELDQLVNAGLGLFDPSGQHHPELAAAVPTLENGLWRLFPDGRMETTWNLKPRTVWQDGEPFSSADVLFTARVAQDRDLPIVRPPGYAFVDSIEARGPDALVIVWKQPYIDADSLFTQQINSTVTPLPRHILEGSFAAGDRGAFMAHPYWSEGFVGTGPFRLRSWSIGSNLVLEANSTYVLGRPKIDAIEVRFLLDTNVIVANVLAGEVQLTLGGGMTMEQAILARSQWRQGNIETPLVYYTAMWPQFLNPDPAVLVDVRFRRALYHALDRQQMVDTFLGGLVPVANSIVFPDAPEFNAVDSNAVRYPYDPAAARRLLEEVPSIQRGADGFYLERETGKRISIEVNTRTNDLRERLQPVIGDMWAQVGIAADPVVIPEQLASDPAARAEFRSFRFMQNPQDVNRYHGNTTPLPENRFRGNNYSRYRSAELDALIDRYNLTIPTAERYEVLGHVVRHMTENLNVLPLFFDAEPVMISGRLVNVGTRRGVSLQTWNVNQWDVR